MAFQQGGAPRLFLTPLRTAPHSNPAAPVISSDGGGDTASLSIAAGGTAVTTVTATGHGPITYSITGGADAALFTINPSTGVLTFLDDSAAGTYAVEVTATGRGGLSDTQAISIAVGAGGLPDAPSGFAYLVNADGAYIINADGAYILAKV